MASVFVSYSHRDGNDAVMTALRPLEREGLLSLWADDRIPPGGDWRLEIDNALAQATAAVLLISPDFFASDFIVQHELPVLLARAEAGLLTLLPVFLRSSVVETLEINFTDLRTGEPRRVKLSKYQGFGSPSQPLAARRPVDRDKVYTRLAEQLVQLPAPGQAAPTPPGPPASVAVARRIPHELPPAAEEFFGRHTELERLVKRLREGKNTSVVGPAGLGKTALAAEAVRAVAGSNPEELARSPFPDGVVFLDLYTFRGQTEPAWNTLANKLDGPALLERAPARERAEEACRARRILLVVEGGEEADGEEGRAGIAELFSVLSPQNCWLLLTRLSTQAAPAASVELKEALHPADAERLLDALTGGRLAAVVRERILGLLDGHPLALTWAGSLLARDEDDPDRLVGDWEAGRLPALSDLQQAQHTLEWLFSRSVRGLNAAAQQALATAGLLARAPVPLAAVTAALGEPGGEDAAREAIKALVRRGLLRWSGELDHWQFTHVLGYRFARQETGSDPEMRERLGHWFHGHLTAALAAPGDSPLALTRMLEHVAALLRADDDQRLWWPLAVHMLYATGDRLTDLGRLALVKLGLGAVAGWLEQFPADKAQEPLWLRERSVLREREGNELRYQGDLSGALTAYREALVVRQRLATDDPANAGWQRDLSVSHNKLGDVLTDQGDLSGALAAYRESLAVRQRLAAADPANTEFQRDLTVSYGRVGEVLSAQGDLSGALAAYRESLAVIQSLAAAEPSNAGWQHDLTVSYTRVGEVLGVQGDLSGALTAYQEALAVIQPLVVADPSNVALQRDQSASLSKVGDVLATQGDLPGALAAYREVLAVLQRLAAGEPSNAGWQRDLSVSHIKMGGALSAQGDLSEALKAYREALAVLQRLAMADSSNMGWQRDRSISLRRVAEIHDQQGDRAEALRLAEESLLIAERLVALDRTNVMWQKDVAASRTLVARLRG